MLEEMTWGSPVALRSGAPTGKLVFDRPRGEQGGDEPPPAARHPSRAVSRGRSDTSFPVGAKDGKSCPGAKRPRRFRGVENNNQRNQKS
ncbi:MAG TPA: hypothetical protein DCE47_23850 [Planctomycetaceae bacterium]|nr:hypothetical protein [Planctomycetaceae bacterium]